MQSVTIKLAHPLPNRAEVRLRRPTIGDLRAVENARGSDLRRSLIFLQRLSGVSRGELRKMDAADLERMAEAVAAFAPDHTS